MDELRSLVRALDELAEPFSFILKNARLELLSQKRMNSKGAIIFFEYVEKKLAQLDYLHLSASDKQCITRLVFYAQTFSKSQPDKTFVLRAFCLSLAGVISFEQISKKEYKEFVGFVRVNNLDDALVSISKKLMFDEKKGLYFPVYLNNIEQWIPVQKIVFTKSKERLKATFNNIELFEVYENYRLTEEYVFSYKGLKKHNRFSSYDIIPHNMQDPLEWDKKHVLEVATISQRKSRPSMLYNNHAYLVLKDDKGFIRSIGQDFLVYFREPKYLEAFGYKQGQGLITTPDTSVFSSSFKRKFSIVSFVISKKQHDKILDIVKQDKKNLDRTASLIKGNCASYVARLLRLGAKIEVDPFMSGTHIFFKHFITERFYRPFRRTHYMPKWLKYILFYSPPIYIVQVCIGIGTLTMSNKSLNRKRDFSLFDVFFRPYKVGADHPLKLIRELEKKKGQ